MSGSAGGGGKQFGRTASGLVRLRRTEAWRRLTAGSTNARDQRRDRLKADPTSGLYLCAWLPVFRVQAAMRGLPREPAAALERLGPLECIAAANLAARQSGVMAGMAAPQALGRCPTLLCRPVEPAAERELRERLRAAADRVSPRVQAVSDDLCLLDFAGLERLHGSIEAAAQRLEVEFMALTGAGPSPPETGAPLMLAPARGRRMPQAVAVPGYCLRTGIADRPAAALLAARSGLGRLRSGEEAAALAPLPLRLLADLKELTAAVAPAAEVDERLDLLRRWGVRTLGELAALPADALASRLGRTGVYLRALARGEVGGLLNTPPVPEATLTASSRFDPPARDLEAIRAALEHLLLELAPQLERRDLAVERAELRLVVEKRSKSIPQCLKAKENVRMDAGAEAPAYQPPAYVYAHDFAVPVPVVLGAAVPGRAAPSSAGGRAIVAQLHLAIEERPPAGAVEAIELTLALTRPRRVQADLFAAGAENPEKMPRLLARLAEIYRDEGHERVGSPRLLDTHCPQAFAMEAFGERSQKPEDRRQNEEGTTRSQETGDRSRESGRGKMPRLALRVFRSPPRFDPRDAAIVRRAGPWRSQGGWWKDGWACDEWDVELRATAAGGRSGLFRLQHDLAKDEWYILGRYD